jgi:hypothetical protein
MYLYINHEQASIYHKKQLGFSLGVLPEGRVVRVSQPSDMHSTMWHNRELIYLDLFRALLFGLAGKPLSSNWGNQWFLIVDRSQVDIAPGIRIFSGGHEERIAVPR